MLAHPMLYDAATLVLGARTCAPLLLCASPMPVTSGPEISSVVPFGDVGEA